MFHAFFIIFWLYTTVLYVQNQKTGSFPTLHLCNNVRRMTRVQLLAYMLFPSYLFNNFAGCDPLPFYYSET